MVFHRTNLLPMVFGILLLRLSLTGSSELGGESHVESISAQHRHWEFWKEKLGVPYFSNTTQTVVLATIGHTTYLHCLVGNLGDRQVSWIRRRDLRILAIGKIRYTQDTRFTPLHDEGNDVWALKIQDVRPSDTGQYECQVSYHDDVEKKLKKPIRLYILDSFAMVDGSEERHVKAGSRLHLVCRVYDSSGPPSYVYWYRDDSVINYSGRKDIQVWVGDQVTHYVENLHERDVDNENSTTTPFSTTKEVSRSRALRLSPHVKGLVVSMLQIQNVMPVDAGSYTCSPSNARNHSVVVHVIQGENLAMQRENEGGNSVPLSESVTNMNNKLNILNEKVKNTNEASKHFNSLYAICISIFFLHLLRG